MVSYLLLICCFYVQDLHALGARRFALIGLGLIGCIPHEISIHGENGSICVDEENRAALMFNDKLKPVVDRFNKELPDAKFIFINSAVISLRDSKDFNTSKLQGNNYFFFFFS